MKGLWFIIEDDWELRGNGLGSVAHLQYTPAVFLAETANQLGIKVTFMAEVLQQIAMERYVNQSRKLRIATSLWRETVSLLIEYGHDVQLHLHPQWFRAVYEDGYFRHAGSWNIAEHDAADVRQMIEQSICYLTDLIRPLQPNYKIVAFKAGTWALQPSQNILPLLSEAGIQMVMGPGLAVRRRARNFTADYRNIEEPILPYCPELSDVEKVARRPNNLVVLPMPYYKPGAACFLSSVANRVSRQSTLPDSINKVPRWVFDAAPSFVGSRSVMQILRSHLELRIFDIAAARFAEMRAAIDQIVRRAVDTGVPVVPIVLQSHTKLYDGNWSDIRRFLAYLRDAFPAAEFLTLTQACARRNEMTIRGINAVAA